MLAFPDPFRVCAIRRVWSGYASLGPEQEVTLMCVVRGYHVYKDVWDPYPEDDFVTKHQRRI